MYGGCEGLCCRAVRVLEVLVLRDGASVPVWSAGLDVLSRVPAPSGEANERRKPGSAESTPGRYGRGNSGIALTAEGRKIHTRIGSQLLNVVTG